METKLRIILDRAISERVFPGAVVGVVTREGRRTIVPTGHFRYENTQDGPVHTGPSCAENPIVREDTIYDVSSITKSIPTAMLALRLVEEGKLSLNDQLIRYLPEFSGPWREEVKVRHLLTYTLPYHVKDHERMASFSGGSAAELLRTLFARGLDAAPGTGFVYSNRGAVFMGLVLERVSGKSLHALAEEYFFKPLGMVRTTFFPIHKTPLCAQGSLVYGIAPSEQDAEGNDICGVVHDEGSRVFFKEGRVNGTAGLFSTVPDLLTFMEMLLRGGELHGQRYFSEAMVMQMETNQLTMMPVRPRPVAELQSASDLTDESGLGWELRQPHWMGKYAGPHTFGKTGFTGARIVADRAKGKAMVLLANRIYPKRQKTAASFNKVSAALCEIVFV